MKDKTFCRNQGISYNPPDGMENVSLQDRLKDYSKLSNDEMLKKYGIKMVYEVWEYTYEAEGKSKIKNPGYFHD